MKKRLTLYGQSDNNAEVPGEITRDDHDRVRINPYLLGQLFLKRKKLIIGAVLAVMIVAAAYSLTLSNLYISRATVLPTGQEVKFSELQNLAGLSPFTGQEPNSQELLPVIINSDLVRDSVAAKTYSFTDKGETKQINLNEYYEAKNPDRMHARLEKMTLATLDKKTGVLTVTVETEYPGLSQAVLKEYLNQVETFNRQIRRSEAKERADYLMRQIAETRMGLSQAEDKLESYRQANMDWAISADPVTIKEMGQLQREVDIKSQKYLFLNQEYEAALLDAQKDIPVLSILDQPSLPVEKSGPRRSIIVIASGIIAFFVILFFVVCLDTITKITRGRDRREFDALYDDFQTEFPRSARVVSRISEKLIRT